MFTAHFNAYFFDSSHIMSTITYSTLHKNSNQILDTKLSKFYTKFHFSECPYRTYSVVFEWCCKNARIVLQLLLLVYCMMYDIIICTGDAKYIRKFFLKKKNAYK